MSNIEKVREIVQGMMGGDDRDFNGLISKDLLISSPVASFGMQGSSSERLMDVFRYWKKAFPGVKSEWISVVEDNERTVTVNWKANAIHTGDDFMGIQAQGKAITYRGRTTYSFSDGKLARYNAEVDLEEIKRALQDTI